MEKKYEILHKYPDVMSKLAEIGLKDIFLLGEIQKDAVNATAQNFNMTYQKVNELVGGSVFQYTESELPIVTFFHEYLRKKLGTHQ